MSELIPFSSPNSKQELFNRLREIIAKGWIEMPAKVARYNHTGGPGNFLKDSIGLNGNKNIPDIVGWQVKYYTPLTALITLFQKDPKPSTAIRSFVKQYGITDNSDRKSLRHTIKGESATFNIVNDAGNIVVRPLKGNGIVPAWAHDTILNTAALKLRRLMLIRGERKRQMVRFHRVDCFENFKIARFIPLILNGTIAIEFNAREMTPGSDGLRNHGTKFRIAPDDVAQLYADKEKLT